MTGKRWKVAFVSGLSFFAVLAPGLARAASINEYTSGVTAPGGIVIGADGNGWFINGNGIAKIDSSGHVTTFTTGLNPGAAPYALTNGPNDDLWFTDAGTTKAVGYISISGAIHEYSAPAGQAPLQIVEGSDGNMWFYSSGATNAVGKMTPGGSFVTPAYALPTGGEIADNMVLGPDGNIWFSDTGGGGGNSIDRITTSGVITRYPITTTNPFPTNITVGPDGNLWFADNNGSIGRITTGGSIREYTAGLQAGADPDAITAGPDGNVWFTDQYSGQRAIGRVTPSGQITEFKNGLSADLPLDITAGADGDLWVPQASMDPMSPSALAQITPSGQITEITKGVNPTGLQDGDSITPGADGSLWFTDNGATKAVGRITLSPLVSTGAATAVTTTGATIGGSVTPLAGTTAVSVEYGTSPSLGSATAVVSLPASTTKQSVSGSLAGLPAGTTIYYRIAATNAAGETDGTVESFTTTALLPPLMMPPAVVKKIATFDNQQLVLTTPSPSICTASTGMLSITLSSSAIKDSKKAKLRFSGAALYLDRGLRHTTKRTVFKHGKRVKVTVVTYRANAVARRLPATPNLKLAGLKSGRHTLKARVSYAETVKRHGHAVSGTVTKTVTVTFRVC